MQWDMVLFGCAGGLIPDVIRLIKGRYKTELPDYLTSANFYVGLVLLVLLGGVAAVLGGAVLPKEALAYGFAAPEVVSRLLASPKELNLGAPSGIAPVRRFWSF